MYIGIYYKKYIIRLKMIFLVSKDIKHFIIYNNKSIYYMKNHIDKTPATEISSTYRNGTTSTVYIYSYKLYI